MKTNPYAPRVPCHRVVGADGSLTGYSGTGGISKKRDMLLAEGIKFRGKNVDASCFINHFTVYMLRTSANTLYVGYTNDLEKRLKEHQGRGKRAAKYTRSFASVKLVYQEAICNQKRSYEARMELETAFT